MKIVFAGTPDFAAAHLQALLDADFDLVAVYTQPDRPAGRGKKLTPSAVKRLALTHEIPVQQPASLKNDDAQAQLASYQADIMVVVAYGLILPLPILQTPALGCINVHGSILPQWRGAAPIQRGIWAGDEYAGVSIMQMDEGLDTGDVLNVSKIKIEDKETSASLYEKLAQLGPKVLVETLQNFAQFSPQKQDDSQASYAKKLTKEEAKCDWQQTAQQLERNVRAFNPWPVAWFDYQGQNIKIWDAELASLEGPAGEILRFDRNGLVIGTKDKAICLSKIQLPNKKPQLIADIINGNPELFIVGSKLL